MSGIDDERYRKNAAEAQQQADRAINDHDRASWLNLAQGWLTLLRGRNPAPQDRTKSDSFDVQDQVQGTNPKMSDASH